MELARLLGDLAFGPHKGQRLSNRAAWPDRSPDCDFSDDQLNKTLQRRATPDDRSHVRRGRCGQSRRGLVPTTFIASRNRSGIAALKW